MFALGGRGRGGRARLRGDAETRQTSGNRRPNQFPVAGLLTASVLCAPCWCLYIFLHPIMSPSTKPHRDLKVNVPRHNSLRIGPVLTANVEAVAREERIRVDVSQTALEPTSALAQAIVCHLVQC